MEAIQLVEFGRPLRARELANPEPGVGEVVVKVRAAGICHSDAHYRAGHSSVGALPLTLGHEVAGVVESVGKEVIRVAPGDRVCLNYMVTCGECHDCRSGREQFCKTSQMIGKDRDGGYAERVVIPERSVVPLPADVPFEVGAVMMCSSATSLRAIRQARLVAGETVAVFGIGGLGLSAVQLARARGASRILAVDIRPAKLALAEGLGAEPIDAAQTDPVAAIRAATSGRGADVCLELIGLPETVQQALRSLGVKGRAAVAGLADCAVAVNPYTELITGERELIGVSDHTLDDIAALIEHYRVGELRFPQGTIQTVALDADEINRALDGVERFSDTVRSVIKPF